MGCQAIGVVSHSHSVPLPQEGEKLIKIRLLLGRVEKKKTKQKLPRTSVKAASARRVRTLRGRTWNGGAEAHQAVED